MRITSVLQLLENNEFCLFSIKNDKNNANLFKNTEKSLDIAEGFIKIELNSSSIILGDLIKGTHSGLEVSPSYETLTDFKLEKFSVFQLTGMQDTKSDILQTNSVNNSIRPLYDNLKEKYINSTALRYYRENCFQSKF